MAIATSPAALVAEYMTRICDLGLTTPSGGNISMTDDEGTLWVTPSQIDKGRLTADDITSILPGGRVTGMHKPSMEYLFHQEIYRSRPDIKAVIHAHPPALVAFSLTGCNLKTGTMPSLCPVDETVGFSPYAVPGSNELGRSVGKTFESGCFSAFMENHGIITTGKNLAEAFYRFESLERIASILIRSKILGEPLLPSTEGIETSLASCSVFAGGRQEILFGNFEQDLRNELAGFAARAYKGRLVTAVSGGFSAKLDESTFLISPEGKDLLFLQPEDLVRIHDGQPQEGKQPSGYFRLHEAVYRRQSFVKSVISAHPVSAMAFAVTGTRPDTRTIPESYLLLNEIPLVPFRMRFTSPGEVARLITQRYPAVLIENDCLTVTGDSIFQAYDRLEVAEFTARSVLDARSVGQIRRLGEAQIRELEKRFL